MSISFLNSMTFRHAWKQSRVQWKKKRKINNQLMLWRIKQFQQFITQFFYPVTKNSHFHVSSFLSLYLSSATVDLSSAFINTSCDLDTVVWLTEEALSDPVGLSLSVCVVAMGTRDVGEECGDSDSSLIGSISGLLSWHTDSCCGENKTETIIVTILFLN